MARGHLSPPGRGKNRGQYSEPEQAAGQDFVWISGLPQTRQEQEKNPVCCRSRRGSKKEGETMATWQQAQNTYEFKRKIGQGGGGAAWLCWHRGLQKEVILKQILRPSAMESENRREVNILKNLRHPSLPGVLDFIEIDGQLFTVMDYISGTNLDDWLKANPNPSLSELQTLSGDICSALQLLHSQNPPIIHCDIKPANIMIRPGCHGVLIDFNTSLDGSNIRSLGKSHGFCPPELAAAIDYLKTYRRVPQGMVTTRSDIYEMGCVLYRMATGTIYNPAQPLWGLIEDRYVPELVPVLQKALAQDPAQRFGSIQEMDHAMQTLKFANERLKKYRKKAAVLSGVYIAGLCSSIVLCGVSVWLMRQSHAADYSQVITAMAAAREDGDHEEVDQLFNEAMQVDNRNLDAYSQQAFSLYEQGKYPECVSFIERSIVSDPGLLDESMASQNIRYLLADSYYRQGKYPEAVKAFDELFAHEELQPSFYRDYAVALGRNNNLIKAQDILEQAAAKGLDDASLQYAQAEVEYARGNTSQAVALMKDVLPKLDADSVKMHAFFALADWYETLQMDEEAQKLLKEASSVLPKSLLPAILEERLQADLDLAAREDEFSTYYRADALETIDEIIANNWDAFATYDARAIILQKMGDLDGAWKELDVMDEKYGESYVTAMRRAFIEVDRQALLPNESRSYAEFARWHDKAKAGYDASKPDAEMDLLERTFREVQEGGWLS